MKMASSSSLSDHEVERRITEAQNICFDLEKTTTPAIAKYVTDYATSIGCPKQFFLVPLQSIAAHFMGPKASVKVHEGWSEPIILCGVVVAHKGQKKSPALGCFHRELTKIEEELKSDTSEIQPRIFVEHFSFEELHYTMKRNNNRILGLYDELSLLYEQLDRYKAGQADRKNILTLINGGCWRRNFRSTTSTIRNTCFNLTGFVKPTTLVRLCNDKDDDGLMDRQLFSCPEEIHYDYDEYKAMPASTPSLSKILKLIDKNNPPNTTYTLTPEAHAEFIHIHDSINQRIRAEHPYDHDRKSILSKAHGQLLRLSATQLNIHQGLSILQHEDEDIQWSYQIPKEILLKSAGFLEYFIAQKFALGNPPHGQTNLDSTDDFDYDWHRICRILELPNLTITPSMISQAHI